MPHKNKKCKRNNPKGWVRFKIDRLLAMKPRLIAEIESLPSSCIKLLELLILRGREYFWYSQTTLAKELGLSRETVNRSLKRLHELGFIDKLSRDNKQTCIFKLASLFKRMSVKKILHGLFMTYSFCFSFMVTQCFGFKLPRANVTQVKLVNKELLKKSITVVERRGRKMSHQTPIPITIKKEAPFTPYRTVIDIDREIRSCKELIENGNFPSFFAQESIKFLNNRIETLENDLQVAMSKLAVFENSFVKG